MGISYNPTIVTDGLVLALDAGNRKSFDGRENLVAYSEYNSSNWTNYFTAGASITTGIEAPDGTATAVRFTCTNTTNALLRVSFPAFTPNGTDTYTTSFYVRKISGSGNAYTDLHDGTPSVNYSSQLVTNQWVRVKVTGVPTNASKSFIDLFSDQNTNYVLDFWGVQVEKNSVASEYTKTTGSTFSRGTTWYDLSGNGRSLTLFNGTAYSDGYFDFDGTDDYAQTSDNGLGTGSLIPHTIEMWVSFDTLSSSRWWLAVIGQYGIGAHHWIGRTGAQFGVWSASCQRSPTLTGTNNWMHLVGTFNGTTLTYYINGINSDGSCTADGFNFTNTYFTIGLRLGSEAYFNGKVAISKIYNKALTASEVKQNFNALRGRFGI